MNQDFPRGDGVDAAGEIPPVALKGKRTDGRGYNDLRNMNLHLTILNRPDGSARWVVARKTLVTAAVYGPLECPLRIQKIDRMVINLSLVLHASSLEPKVRPEMSGRKPVEALAEEQLLVEALTAAVRVRQYPRQALNVAVHVSSADGSPHAAVANAAFAAVMDAGIEMNFMVAAVCLARVVVDGKVHILLDPTAFEESAAVESAVFFCRRDGKLVLSRYRPTKIASTGDVDPLSMATLAGEACKKIAAVVGVVFRQREELVHY